MSTKKFSKAMSELDNKYVEEAMDYKKKAKKTVWLKWGTMAACLCCILVSAFVFPHFIGNNPNNDEPMQETAYGFTLEGSDIQYFPISFSQRKAFGVIDENATGLTDENTYNITTDDLGEIMGIVGNSENASIIGTEVYYFIKFPLDNSICIVKIDGEYQFYVKEGVKTQDIVVDPDTIIDAPVDEDTYHEADPNASIEHETGHYDNIEIEQTQPEPTSETNSSTSPTEEISEELITLEYITELQAKVSEAMSAGELPFVSSSAVYENPYRLHILVSSNAENDLAKLKALDTSGKALEIEYITNSVITE